MIFWLIHFQVIENRNHHSWSCILRAKSVASTYDKWFISPVVENITDIKVQRIAGSTRFFGTVENTDTFYRIRQNVEEIFRRERTIQMNADQANFFTFGIQVIDNFL